ncbi:MAG TPA: hypothetical protein DEF89_03200 [Desulfosporosinus sp.]|nr:hypothetical protein [Desulfosporosinus sp.]
MEEIPDWNCCGSTPAHQVDHLLALALPARNLAQAEKAGLKEVMAPCAACFNHLRTAEIECAESKETSKKVQQAIEMNYKNTVHVLNILELLVDRIGLDKVAAKVKKPLKGLKIAPYYGCMLTRPAKIARFDHPTKFMNASKRSIDLVNIWVYMIRPYPLRVYVNNLISL